MAEETTTAMNNSSKITVIAILSLILMSFSAPIATEIRDYLNAGKQVKFDKEAYDISWSSNPAKGRFMQEYLRAGEKPESFKKMIILQAIERDGKVSDAIKEKAKELDERKKWDAVANYQVYENANVPNEGIIDFVISDTMVNYEWNLYRYQYQKGGDNKGYIVLFGYSYHDVLNDNKDLKKFFAHIKSERADLINKLTAVSIPKIKPGE